MTAIAVAILLVLCNAFFVAAEFSLIATRRSQIEPLAETGNRRARTTLGAIDNVTLMLGGAQLGITACSLGLGATGEPAVAHFLEAPLHAAGIPEGLLHPISFTIALAVVVFIHMVLGEMVPKNVALAGPERAALLLAPPLAMIVRPLRPLISALNHVSALLLRAFGVRQASGVTSAFTREEVSALAAESRGAGLLDEEDHALLSGALAIEDKTAAEVAVPARDIQTVAASVTIGELERLVTATGFSRFPVRGAERGRYQGYIHLVDLLDLLETEVSATPLPAARIRPLRAVRSDAVLGEVLGELRQAGTHLAEVRDATGTTVGVMFFEDVLTALIGDR
ncbi:hemolysin family protein [Actinocorallia longicatena]|uniref:Hemolysin family protein n=1 Tax=Actinocorallia longicatena TaxID=111803 RepID=A0ABP6Q506_9ACTN